ncbi:three-Cys-motif partner protein TcmP [Butyrivibrio sp. XPD2002]|uniref:three-Cys-motif partner protein TcmP n=1 Tax=Butyrivibrio sp. XPD2002 TaxID=1280665 RepID=UPI0003FBC51B|nr:three-Cys-motif partner protein TcmP [Butyrivibrio sp. XPD2002]
MAGSKKNDVISIASPHSIKKFELISEYVKSWVQIIMQIEKCKGIVYIDCMSNSGVYQTEEGEEIEGTALRVSKIIADAMNTYAKKQAYLYFNDLQSEKIDLLSTRLPKQTDNFHIYTDVMDASVMLKKIASQFKSTFEGMHFLLVYDPYDAHIDWEALDPFLKNWGEVIINHMVSDTIRAAKTAKKPEVVKKYEDTYKMTINDLISVGSDRNAYETIIEKIITDSTGRKEGDYHIAVFPFFNSNNAVVYNLLHCTRHKRGFELFKSTAWKIFGDRSSMKNTHNSENQMQLCFGKDGNIMYETPEDDSCYNLRDAALYIHRHFRGKKDVPNMEVWNYLGQHPVFPTEGYLNKIKRILKEEFDMKTSRSSMTFSDRSY